ncbi:hypothetical protein CB0940_10864 [Cercospora beticola]|uniref:Cell wall protein RHD3 n=1 Tax=Cercospora beticola TaxID=122368 RepID=A0A2G5HVT8_CERBT|nr:hypothetical protein CB0940_10864 [Cercospora beticola]PIA96393.1 hypothetical protein CB0940_10864 [Cercospora beticola]WPB07597.1 hypothetical protein RHO25_012258 [Cercospora beticola]CAK1367602.1 unnamed protein product [Cercospora beticola]
MYSALAFAFAALAAATPAPQKGSSPEDPLRVTATALEAGSQGDGQSINADLGSFYIGGRPTGTLSPPAGDTNEYATKNTIFTYVNSQGGLGLSVAVPGGQQVYVDSGDEANGYLAGGLKYTEAETNKTLGGVPLFEGFVNYYDGIMKFEGQDWIACPVDFKGQVLAVWAASRISPNKDRNGCVDFQFKIHEPVDGPQLAWAYKFNPGP